MARTSSTRLLRVPCRSDQHSGNRGLPLGHRAAVATNLEEAKPTRPSLVEADGCAGGSMAASGTRPPSVADTAFHRQSLEVGARCVNCARRDLCGGRAAMLVPTAIAWPLLGGRRGCCPSAGQFLVAAWGVKNSLPLPRAWNPKSRLRSAGSFESECGLYRFAPCRPRYATRLYRGWPSFSSNVTICATTLASWHLARC